MGVFCLVMRVVNFVKCALAATVDGVFLCCVGSSVVL